MWRFVRRTGRLIGWLCLPAGIEHLGLLLASQPFGWQPYPGLGTRR